MDTHRASSMKGTRLVGVILLIVGILGFLLSLVFNGGAGAGSAGTAAPQTTVIKDDTP
jgi:hypothetical protein